MKYIKKKTTRARTHTHMLGKACGVALRVALFGSLRSPVAILGSLPAHVTVHLASLCTLRVLPSPCFRLIIRPSSYIYATVLVYLVVCGIPRSVLCRRAACVLPVLPPEPPYVLAVLLGVDIPAQQYVLACVLSPACAVCPPSCPSCRQIDR